MVTAGADATVDVLVEIPRGSRCKYEYDETTGRIRLDRVLYSSVQYPVDYGFITETRAPDGGHLDAMVLVEEPTFPGCLVAARPIGVLEMRDGQHMDHKILVVPIGDPQLAAVNTYLELNKHTLREIETFFATYKQLQRVQTTIHGWRGPEQAWELIRACRGKWLPREATAP